MRILSLDPPMHKAYGNAFNFNSSTQPTRFTEINLQIWVGMRHSAENWLVKRQIPGMKSTTSHTCLRNQSPKEKRLTDPGMLFPA